MGSVQARELKDCSRLGGCVRAVTVVPGKKGSLRLEEADEPDPL